jgi:hypothetical protein
VNTPGYLLKQQITRQQTGLNNYFSLFRNSAQAFVTSSAFKIPESREGRDGGEGFCRSLLSFVSFALFARNTTASVKIGEIRGLLLG